MYWCPTGADPKFLELVPWGLLQPNGSAPIHEAHVKGIAHAGVWIAVRDSAGKVLLLQRGTQLKTCSGSWGLLGEHMHAGEDVLGAVKRALDEEMGEQLRRQHVERIDNISTVWFATVYEDGREERQATHIYDVRLRDAADAVVLRPDDEVAGESLRVNV